MRHSTVADRLTLLVLFAWLGIVAMQLPIFQGMQYEVWQKENDRLMMRRLSWIAPLVALLSSAAAACPVSELYDLAHAPLKGIKLLDIDASAGHRND